MNTVALFDNANSASFWICVFEGNTPFANLLIIVFGRLRSFGCQLRDHANRDKEYTSTLIPSCCCFDFEAGAGDSVSPFVTTDTLDFLALGIAADVLGFETRSSDFRQTWYLCRAEGGAVRMVLRWVCDLILKLQGGAKAHARDEERKTRRITHAKFHALVNREQLNPLLDMTVQE